MAANNALQAVRTTLVEEMARLQTARYDRGVTKAAHDTLTVEYYAVKRAYNATIAASADIRREEERVRINADEARRVDGL